MQTLRASRGFTLTEVLVVTGVIAVIASLAFPVFLKAMDRANTAKCMSNIRQLNMAISMYRMDHDQKFPEAETVWTAINFPPGMKACPKSDAEIGYGYNQWIGGRAPTDMGMPSPPTLIVLADSDAPNNLLRSVADVSDRHAGKVAVAYADGHVGSVVEEQVTIPVIADHELFTEQVKQWPNANGRVICNNNLGSYWNSWRVNAPNGWESNLFTVNNYGGGYFGPSIGYDMYVGVAGRPSPSLGNNWSTSPSEVYMRIPTPGNAKSISQNGTWVLAMPAFCFPNAGASRDIIAPAGPGIKGISQISVLDNARVPIATFALEMSGTSATYKINDTVLQTVENAAALNPAWPYYSPQTYKYANDLQTHALLLEASGAGTIQCAYSVSAQDGPTGGITVPKLAGDITKPSWVELKATVWDAGKPGNGSVVVYTARYSGGIWWQTSD